MINYPSKSQIFPSKSQISQEWDSQIPHFVHACSTGYYKIVAYPQDTTTSQLLTKPIQYKLSVPSLRHRNPISPYQFCLSNINIVATSAAKAIYLTSSNIWHDSVFYILMKPASHISYKQLLALLLIWKKMLGKILCSFIFKITNAMMKLLRRMYTASSKCSKLKETNYTIIYKCTDSGH